MRKTKQGFTLAELLIVVAIIAVLVAIAIPVFTTQLEKSREATDAANIRSMYAEVMTRAVETGKDVNMDGTEFDKVTLKQTQNDWQNTGAKAGLENIAALIGTPTKGGSAWVCCKYGEEKAEIHFNGGTGGGTGGGDEPGDDTGGGGGGESGGAQYLAGQQVTWMDGSDLKHKSTLTVRIPGDAITSDNTITIYIRKNPGNGQETTQTVTLYQGVAVNESFPINVKENGYINISFSEDIDQETANNLLSYFSAT